MQKYCNHLCIAISAHFMRFSEKYYKYSPTKTSKMVENNRSKPDSIAFAGGFLLLSSGVIPQRSGGKGMKANSVTKKSVCIVLAIVLALGLLPAIPVPGVELVPAKAAEPADGYPWLAGGAIVTQLGEVIPVTDAVRFTVPSDGDTIPDDGKVYVLTGYAADGGVTVSGNHLIILDNLTMSKSSGHTLDFGTNNITLYIPDGTVNRITNTHDTWDNDIDTHGGCAIRIVGPEGKLTVEGGPLGNGQLWADSAGGSQAAAIGSNRYRESPADHTSSFPGAEMTFNGGTVFAASRGHSAAIGGATYHPCGEITINEGIVVAHGDQVGIGSCLNIADNGKITVNGGRVVSCGGTTGIGTNAFIDGHTVPHAGIVEINGGTVVARGGVPVTPDAPDTSSWASIGGGEGSVANKNIIGSGSVGAYVNKNKGPAATAKAPEERPKNEKGDGLFLSTINVVDDGGQLIGGIALSVAVHPGTAYEYTFEAESYIELEWLIPGLDGRVADLDKGYQGKAWFWLPVGAEHIVAGSHGMHGAADITVNVAADDSTEAVLQLENTSLIGKLTHRKPAGIELTARNDFSNANKTIADEAKWIRVPAVLDISYTHDNFDAAYDAAASADKGVVALVGNDSKKSRGTA